MYKRYNQVDSYFFRSIFIVVESAIGQRFYKLIDNAAEEDDEHDHRAYERPNYPPKRLKTWMNWVLDHVKEPVNAAMRKKGCYLLLQSNTIYCCECTVFFFISINIFNI